MNEIDRHIRKTLKDILIYIGGDIEYANNAQLQTYIEWVIRKAQTIKNREIT